MNKFNFIKIEENRKVKLDEDKGDLTEVYDDLNTPLNVDITKNKHKYNIQLNFDYNIMLVSIKPNMSPSWHLYLHKVQDLNNINNLIKEDIKFTSKIDNDNELDLTEYVDSSIFVTYAI